MNDKKETQTQSLRYTAEAYVGKKTLNIADLATVEIDVPMTTRTFKEDTPDQFEIWVALVNEEEYKVPNMVISQLQGLLAAFPKLKHFKVLKKGEGMNTTYQTVPLGV